MEIKWESLAKMLDKDYEILIEENERQALSVLEKDA